MTTKQKIINNTLAIKTVLENSNSKYINKEIEVVQGWNGSGNMKGLLWGDGAIDTWSEASKEDISLYPEYMKFYEVLRDNLTGKEYTKVTDSLRASVLTQYLTPSVIPSTFYQVFNQYAPVQNLYDPCAGSGTFIIEAVGKLEKLQAVCAYEKDIVTGRILDAIVQSLPIPVQVNVKPFEESDDKENDQYDLVTSNVPFGAFGVFDPACKDRNVLGRVHNYFVWKGLQKVKEQGLLAIVITNAFLDTISNRSAREWLFMNSDFISLSVLPDNLFKDIANTMAPSHFLVVRKNTGKTEMSEEEKLLCVSEMHTACGVTFSLNKYCQKMCGDIVIGDVQVGKNQYGKPAREVWWSGAIEDIAYLFESYLRNDFEKRYKKEPIVEEIPPWEVRKLPEENHTCDDCGTIVWDLSEKFCPECILAHNDEGIPWDDDEAAEYEDYHSTVEPLEILKAQETPSWIIKQVEKITPLKLSDIPASVKAIMPIHQQRAIVGSTEHWGILERIKSVVDSMPGPYGQEEVDTDDKIVYLHYFYGACDWYIVEKDSSDIQYQMYCYANLGDDMCAEWGYVGMPELSDNKVELDFFWTPRKFSQIHEKVAVDNLADAEWNNTIEPQEQVLVKKGPSKKDKEILADYMCIKEAYNALEIAEKENQ